MVLQSAAQSLKKTRKFKTKGHLTMKDMLLQEKLLGNLGRWEEATSNQKVGPVAANESRCSNCTSRSRIGPRRAT